jgi:2-polyprenyl-3-methyl-5-hydroxy-6-metoxy-1,4-benzoquinol methylase
MGRMVGGDRRLPLAAAEATVDGTRCPACGGALGGPPLESSDRLCGLPGTFSVVRCELCGMGVTQPAVEDAQVASFYPTTYGTYERLSTGVLGLVSTVVQRLQSRQALRSEPFRRLAEMPAGRLLDVGCGRGDLGAWFVRRGWSVVGVEPSPQACAVARGRGVDARTGTLGGVTVEPRAYDAVVFRHSLEHVTDPAGDLRRAREALRDGGVAIVSVPNFGCWQSRRFGGCWFHLDLPRHRFHFNAKALRAMLANAGFTRVETSTSSLPMGIPASIQYALAGRCLVRDGLKLRVTMALGAPLTPFVRLLDRLAGEGEVLHAAAHTRWP